VNAKVYITYKPGVLDPQGQTVFESLQHQGQTKIKSVRIGKVIEFELAEMSHHEAEVMLTSISQNMLANPVIETYRVEMQ
jgi:phosphoribosylformylglycinamidine synthase